MPTRCRQCRRRWHRWRSERLARSRDDAAGEAFDKVARLLELGYPGGPAIQAAAASGDPRRFALPKGRVSLPQGGFHPYDFSFSGLKTAVLRLVNQLRAEEAGGGDPFPLADVAASFREAVIDVLLTKALWACEEFGVNRLLLGGGVVANARLREEAERRCQEAGIELRIPRFSLCTDNGAMIAFAGCQRLLAGEQSDLTILAKPRWPMDGLLPPGEINAEEAV